MDDVHRVEVGLRVEGHAYQGAASLRDTGPALTVPCKAPIFPLPLDSLCPLLKIPVELRRMVDNFFGRGKGGR